MAFLLIFRKDQAAFIKPEVFNALALIGCHNLLRNGTEGAAITGEFQFGHDTVLIELKSDLETFAVSDSGPASFEFAVRLQSRLNAPLRIVDEAYSFDLELMRFSTAEQLERAIQAVSTPENTERFGAAIARFDAENAQDPKSVVVDYSSQPHELVYSRWLTDWVLRLAPDASEPLRLAARCQHLRRWEIPRESYPATRAGYLKWRQVLKEFHADKAAEILREVGYGEEVIHQVRALNLKKNIPADAESRILEDALCLVFLERQFAKLAAKTTEEKIITALQKSWGKMTPAGHAEALKLNYTEEQKRLLGLALGK